MRVTGTAKKTPVDQPLEPGTQDGLSRADRADARARGRTLAASFWLIDKDEVKEYQYTQRRHCDARHAARQARHGDLHAASTSGSTA